MIIVRVLLPLSLILAAQSAVTINQITGIVQNNLMYTGTIGVGTEKLFFTYYGIDGEANPANLASKPLFIAVGAPGRSAQYINLAGIGPKLLKNDLTLTDNANRVTQFANVMFLDLLGSGYSFASASSAVPSTAKDYGAMLTNATNSFIAETQQGKSKTMYFVAESTFLRVLPGLDDIEPLKGIIHISAWFDLYELGVFYGSGGLEMKIFTNTERNTIDATMINCHLYQLNNTFTKAHQCYDDTLNYVENRTKNLNLFNIQLQSNLTDALPMVQFYFSQPSVASTYKAPSTNNLLFEAHSDSTRTWEGTSTTTSHSLSTAPPSNRRTSL
jgi:hypothetical protein